MIYTLLQGHLVLKVHSSFFSLLGSSRVHCRSPLTRYVFPLYDLINDTINIVGVFVIYPKVFNPACGEDVQTPQCRVAPGTRVALRYHGPGARLPSRAMALFPMINMCLVNPRRRNSFGY